jgi:hypothetical protein
MATKFISERLSVFGPVPLVAVCSINDMQYTLGDTRGDPSKAWESCIKR